MPRIAEIRILPTLAIARLGSSPFPMDNYTLEILDPLGYRQIVPTATLKVNSETGEIDGVVWPDSVRFRDQKERIRPIAPFFEVWVRFRGSNRLVPLTKTLLGERRVH